MKYGDREVCNKHTPGGQAEYRSRLVRLHQRQYDPKVEFNRCCVCRLRLELFEATFEHEDGRNPRFIDERIEVVVDGVLKKKNGASHGHCNCQRGSKRTPIWHGPEDDPQEPAIKTFELARRVQE